MGDHGRSMCAQEWVSADGERRSNALADRGSHPNHRCSSRGPVLRFTSRGYRIKAKVVYIADPGLADGSTRVVGLGDSLRCCG